MCYIPVDVICCLLSVYCFNICIQHCFLTKKSVYIFTFKYNSFVSHFVFSQVETEPTLPARSVLGLIMELRDMPAVDDLVLSIAKRPDQVRGGVGGAVHEHTARPGEGGRGGEGGLCMNTRPDQVRSACWPHSTACWPHATACWPHATSCWPHATACWPHATDCCLCASRCGRLCVRPWPLACRST